MFPNQRSKISVDLFKNWIAKEESKKETFFATKLEAKNLNGIIIFLFLVTPIPFIELLSSINKI